MSPTGQMEQIGEDLFWANGLCWRPCLVLDNDGKPTTMWHTIPDDELWEEVFTVLDEETVCVAELPEMQPGESPSLDDLNFAFCWEELAEEGACDGSGGAEYRRVKREWNEAGRPQPVREFIRAAANRGPDAASWPATSPATAARFLKGVRYEA